MPYPVSIARAHHRFDGPGKAVAREHTLKIARSTAAAGLCDPISKRLRCDWAELAGESCERTVTMLETAEALRPGGFIGIDYDRALIARLRHTRPDLKWMAGDVRHLIGALNTHEIGVMNFDGYLQVGTDEAAAFFTNVRPLIKRGYERFGAFVLCSNNSLDSVFRCRQGQYKGKPSAALLQHAKAVVDALKDYAPRRTLRLEQLLPADFERKADSRYFGPLGAFFLYTNSKGGQRQALLTLVL